MWKCLCGMAVSLVLSVASASAQTPVDDTEERPSPNFITLDRNDERSVAGASVGVTLLNGSSSDTATRVDLYSRQMLSREFGIHAAVPLSYVPGLPDGEGTGVGNLELGGYYIADSDLFPTIFQVSVVVPTASTDERFLHQTTVPARFSDVIVAVPDATSLRLSSSIRYRKEQLFLRGDVGFDIPLGQPDFSEIPPVIRMNVGAGIDMGRFAASAELVNLLLLDEFGDSPLINVFTLGIQSKGSWLEPYLALSLPLDDQVREAVKATLIFGVQLPFKRKDHASR